MEAGEEVDSDSETQLKKYNNTMNLLGSSATMGLFARL